MAIESDPHRGSDSQPRAGAAAGPAVVLSGITVSGIALAIAAVLLLCANLGHRYLWQDEAATAVLANRLFEHGKPLAYDGRNLITMDLVRPDEAEEFAEHLATPDETVSYYVAKGDFKADTTWIGQPWGQFVAAGLSLKLLGQTTVAARLPFALAAVATAVLLFYFAQRALGDLLVAWTATALLLSNVYWILHMRQCRYYALSALLLLCVVIAFWRWQQQARYGGLLLGISGWLFFQCDYGSFWPALGVLFVWALASRRTPWQHTLLVFGGLGLAVLPFVFYYELIGRGQAEWFSPLEMTASNLALLNQFQLPLIVAAGCAVGLLAQRDDESTAAERRLGWLCLALIGAQVVWLVWVAPAPFYRYLVNLTPLSSLLMAIYLASLVRGFAPRWRAYAVCAVGVVLLSATEVLSLPGGLLLPLARVRGEAATGQIPLLRDEWHLLAEELRGLGPDPNRAAVEFLRERTEPEDEILVNYEDIPLMFYLPNPIRGGMAMFRVAAEPAPRFVVVRSRPPLFSFQSDLFTSEIERHAWTDHRLEMADFTWGNNPDPFGNRLVLMRDEKWSAPSLSILELTEADVAPVERAE